MDVFLPRDDSVPSSVVNYVDEQKKTASFYDTSKLETRDKYAMFFNGNHGKVVITTPTEENLTLLVIKDIHFFFLRSTETAFGGKGSLEAHGNRELVVGDGRRIDSKYLCKLHISKVSSLSSPGNPFRQKRFPCF